jgi:DNA invertase Pin-like site-specific DNA recombinase
MKFGYMRVSTDEQNLDRQEIQLKEAGCDKVFWEKISGTKKHRPA